MLVEPHEAKAHGRETPVIVLPKSGQGLPWARQWVTEFFVREIGAEGIAMMDDDLSFRHRGPDGRLAKASSEEVGVMCDWLQLCLKRGVPLAGISNAGGNNRVKGRVKMVARQSAVHAINARLALFCRWKWDRVLVMEDFDFILQVLKSGQPNIVSYRWAYDQSSNSEGGCSTYRTAKVQRRSAELLARLHAPFVKVVKKKAWEGMGASEQHDVRIQWAKAYEHGKSTRRPRRGGS